MSDTDKPPREYPGLTYGKYLKVSELLELQSTLVAEHSHDELLFIIIHQAYELWFKQILYELDTVRELMRSGNPIEARRLLDRVAIIGDVLVKQIHILETMTPRDFCHFRAALRPASGFQSAQFRELEYMCGAKDPSYLVNYEEGSIERLRLERRLAEPSLRETFYRMLQTFGYDVPEDPGPDDTEQVVRALLPVYRNFEDQSAIYHLCEALVSHDQWIATWRFHHVRTVERIIGSKRGTGGSSGVPYLMSTVSKRLFPLLWEVRAWLDDDDLFATYKAPGGG